MTCTSMRYILCEMHAYEMHAYEIHAYEIHVYEMHAVGCTLTRNNTLNLSLLLRFINYGRL
jgi:hypothetical protein